MYERKHVHTYKMLDLFRFVFVAVALCVVYIRVHLDLEPVSFTQQFSVHVFAVVFLSLFLFENLSRATGRVTSISYCCFAIIFNLFYANWLVTLFAVQTNKCTQKVYSSGFVRSTCSETNE